MGKMKVSPEKYALSIAGCKKSRNVGMCEKKCSHWHPMSRNAPLFCKSAEYNYEKHNNRQVSNCYNCKR